MGVDASAPDELSVRSCFLRSHLSDGSALPHDRQLRDPDEQSVLDHAWHFIEHTRELCRIGDFAEGAIQDVMAFIRHER